MERFTGTEVPTPFGDLTIVCSGTGIVATAFAEGGPDDARGLESLEAALGGPIAPAAGPSAAVLHREVAGYVRGEPDALRAPVDLRLVRAGFPRRVLEITRSIPFGELRTYGDVAAAAGSPRGGRAAGGALSRCPIELWVPCHRVVHADGHVGGYGRHEDRKRALLGHEGAVGARGRA
jgi:methylated-DNA-[protein]-cysteine S-methyltransferase